jgi:predicted acylesterase/phospholipase RssA
MSGDPVLGIPDEPDKLEPGIALCLSGGGYRAMLFHLGALWRLNEAGYLPRLDRVSSVSGGSMMNGALALGWTRLGFDDAGVGQNFGPAVVEPVRKLAGKTIDVWAILRGVLLPGPVGDKYAGSLKKHLLGNATLQDLPDRPRFIFNATNLQSAVLFRFSKPYMRDYHVGEIKAPRTAVATAVAASGAFPPLLSPVTLKPAAGDWTPGSGMSLQQPPYTTKVDLADGGVYDNLGLETAWKRYRTILISDGGGRVGGQPKVKHNWVQQPLRVLGVIDSQVRALRKRQAIDGFKRGDREGTYWGIRTDIADYGLSDALPCPADQTLTLARTATRLKSMDAVLQERLINWGYAVCDAAMRSHVDSSLALPSGFPYPSAGVG